MPFHEGNELCGSNLDLIIIRHEPYSWLMAIEFRVEDLPAPQKGLVAGNGRTNFERWCSKLVEVWNGVMLYRQTGQVFH